MKNKEISTKSIKNIFMVFLFLTIVLLPFNKTMFFNLGNYFILPSITIFFAFMVHYIEFKNINLDKNILIEKTVCSIPLFLVFINMFRGFDFDMLAATILCYLFILVVSTVKYSRKEIKTIEYSYILYGLILALRIIILARQPYLDLDDTRYGAYYSSSDFYNVNATSVALGASFYLSLKNVLNKNNTVAGMLNGLFSFIIALAIVMTGSRAGFITILSLIISSIFIKTLEYKEIKNSKSNISKKNIYMLVVSVVILVGFFMAILVNYVDSDVIIRLINRSYLTTNSLRFRNWGYGIELFKMNPIFGFGIYNTGNIYKGLFGNSVSVHSTFLVILVQYGLLGLFGFLFYFLTPVKKLFNNKNFFSLTYYLLFLFSIMLIESQSTLILMVITSLIFIQSGIGAH